MKFSALAIAIAAAPTADAAIFRHGAAGLVALFSSAHLLKSTDAQGCGAAYCPVGICPCGFVIGGNAIFTASGGRRVLSDTQENSNGTSSATIEGHITIASNDTDTNGTHLMVHDLVGLLPGDEAVNNATVVAIKFKEGSSCDPFQYGSTDTVAGDIGTVMEVNGDMKDIAAIADVEGRSKGSALVMLPNTVDYFFESPVVLVDVTGGKVLNCAILKEVTTDAVLAADGMDEIPSGGLMISTFTVATFALVVSSVVSAVITAW